MAKDTRLDESADIYQPRDKRTEKQKLSSMTSKEKVAYLLEYYKYKALAAVIGIGFLVYIVYVILSPKVETVFYAAVINDYLDNEKVEQFNTDFSNYLNLSSDSEDVILDNSYYITIQDGNVSATSATSEEKLMAYISVNQIDVIIADESDFKRYAELGYFVDLSDQLPTQLYSKLSDKLYFATAEEDTTEEAYGVYLSDSEKYRELGSVIEHPVMGIIANSKYKNNSISFLKYMLDLN